MDTQADKVYHFMIYHPKANTKLRGQVACVFCNKRKLKCSKTKPCYQCAKRNQECVYLHELEEANTISEEREMIKLSRKRESLMKCLEYYTGMASQWKQSLDNLNYSSVKTNIKTGNCYKTSSQSSYIKRPNYFDTLNQPITDHSHRIDSYIKNFQEVVEVVFPGIKINLPNKDAILLRLYEWILITPPNEITVGGNFLKRSSITSLLLCLELCIAFSLGTYFEGENDIAKKFSNMAMKLYLHLLFSNQILIASAHHERWLAVSLLLSLVEEYFGRQFSALSILNIAFQSCYQNLELRRSSMLVRVVTRLARLSINDYERSHWIKYAQKSTEDKVLLMDVNLLEINSVLKSLDFKENMSIRNYQYTLQACLSEHKRRYLPKRAQILVNTSCMLHLLEIESQLDKPKISALFGKFKKMLSECDGISTQILFHSYGDLLYKWTLNSIKERPPIVNQFVQIITSSNDKGLYSKPYEDDIFDLHFNEHSQDATRSIVLSSAYFSTSSDVLCGM